MFNRLQPRVDEVPREIQTQLLSIQQPKPPLTKREHLALCEGSVASSFQNLCYQRLHRINRVLVAFANSPYVTFDARFAACYRQPIQKGVAVCFLVTSYCYPILQSIFYFSFDQK